MRLKCVLLFFCLVMMITVFVSETKLKRHELRKLRRRQNRQQQMELMSKKVNHKKTACNTSAQISSSTFCDDVTDCLDYSDEVDVNCPTCLKNISYPVVSCNNADNEVPKTCFLPREQFCQERVTCRGVSPCDVGCQTHFRCPDNKTCLKRSTVCDRDTCDDCPGVQRWNNGPGFKCVRNGMTCNLPQVLLNDGIKDCDDGSDLCYDPVTNITALYRDIRANSNFNTSRCFQCLDNSMIVSSQSVCDDVIDCPDLSDECLCEGELPKVCVRIQSVVPTQIGRNCTIGQVKCGNGHCIDKTSVCNGILDCNDGLDEEESYCGGTKPCMNATAGETCRCSLLARKTCKQTVATYCDDQMECVMLARGTTFDQPAEDECAGTCHVDKIAAGTHNASDTDCLPPTPRTKPFKCRGIGKRDLVSVQKTINASQVCDGIPDCKKPFSDERRCRSRYKCPTASGAVSIKRFQRCDGFVDCLDGKDELKDRCRKRHYCKSLNGARISISTREICDYVINCDDQSDEINCQDNRFYCENKQPLFVRKHLLFNGVPDCSDWSDECPSVRNRSDVTSFSSRYELIGNPVLRVLVWIMGFLAVMGNSAVIFTTIRSLRQTQQHSLKANNLLVLNLAVADFLMGMYLLILGAVGVVYSGRYCSLDLYWRTSSRCTALGILVVLSSEASVMTMVLLTSFRLYAVLNPFRARTKPKIKVVVLLILLAWGISFVLALVPISETFQVTFTDGALLEDNLFFRRAVVKFDTFQRFVTRLATFYPKTNTSSGAASESLEHIGQLTSWYQLRKVLDQSNLTIPNLNMGRYFGYYSDHSVCVPRIFVTQRDNTWTFSLGVLCFNLMSFLYVAVAYIYIYCRSTEVEKIASENRSAKTSKRSQEMQKKIFRLIVTDFCCWVPVSIMAFVNFSGVKVPSDAYAFSAILLLPINSALNPIVYSHVWTIAYDKIRKKGKAKATSSVTNSSSSRPDTKVESTKL